MAIYYYNKQANYKLKSTANDVYVSIVSGNGQGGSYMILKEMMFIGANETVYLGKANELVDVSIQISVTIQDKLIETNWTGVIVIISEGTEITTYSYAEELPADKDIAYYFIVLKLDK